jgi:hypothetical protein
MLMFLSGNISGCSGGHSNDKSHVLQDEPIIQQLPQSRLFLIYGTDILRRQETAKQLER